MNSENSRLDRAFAVLDALEQSEAYPTRVVSALESLRGFVLTGASDAVRNAIESSGTRLNAVFQSYPKAAPEAFPELNEEDARELAIELRQVAELIRDDETEQILDRLRHPNRILPEAAVAEARRHQAWFIPHLIRECRDQIAKLKELDNPDGRLPDDQHNSVPFLSLFLFSEWHVPDSVPVILESLKLPGEAPFELYGDAIHEVLPRYLAQFLPERLDELDAIVRNPNANIYVRWCSANSYKYLVRDGKISVDDAVVRLDRLFHETKIVGDGGSAGWDHPYELSAGIVGAICDIGGSSRSTIPADKQHRNFIDESIADFDEPDERSGATDERSEATDDGEPTTALRRLPPTRVEDCLALLRHWAAFRPPPEPVRPSAVPKPRERPIPAAPRPTVPNLSPPSTERLSQATRVPRNARCPCGSGKKYKQCCLRKTS